MTYEEAIKDLEQLKQSFYDLDINKSLCGSLNMAIEAMEKQNSCKDCAGCTQWLCDCEYIKEEVINEFAEKAVRELTANYSDEYCHWIDDTIDKIVKEMVGGTE